MKKLVALFILIAAAGGGWWYYITYGKPPEKATVNFATVSQGNIVEAVSSTGTLEPMRRVDVGSQVSGVVKDLYIDFNSIVKAGQLLAELDPSLLQVQVDIQTANIERQKGDIASQKVQLEDQKKQLERTKSLFDKGLQNQQQLDAAELAIKTRDAQILSSEKQLVSAEANLASAKLNLSYTKIYSPIDGVVVDRRVDRGQTVQASMNTPSFFILATPLQTLKLTAMVDEAEIGKIRPGMEVRFSVDAYGQQQFIGTVDAVRLNASTANNVVTYPVWINVSNPDLKLRPSMTANLRIVISTADDVVRVPNQALRFRPNAEIYTALGLTPPAAGQGRPAGGGPAGADENGRGGGRQGAQPPATSDAAGRQGGRTGAQPQGAAGSGRAPQAAGERPAPGQGQPGQPAQTAEGGRTGGRGFGGSDLANMTPEQRQALMERFGRTGGRGGQGGGRGGNQATGQGGRGGGRGAQPPQAAQGEQSAEKIDQLWAPVQRAESRASVWTWDEAKKELKQIQLRLGVTDGTFSELLSGDIKVGDRIVTGVVLPASARAAAAGNPLFGSQPSRSGMPGMGGSSGMSGFGGGGPPSSGGSGGSRGGGGGR